MIGLDTKSMNTPPKVDKRLIKCTLLFLPYWLTSFVIFFVPMWALAVAGIVDMLRLRPYAWASALLSIVLALLLAADKYAALSLAAHTTEMSFAGLVYEVLIRRKSLLAIFVVAAGGVATAIYYAARPYIQVEQEKDSDNVSGLSIRLHTINGTRIDDYFAIHPYGWQDTKIQFQKTQKFTVGISGQVSPGIMQSFGRLQKYIEARNRYDMHKTRKSPVLPDILWPFSDPTGYDRGWYPQGSCPTSTKQQSALTSLHGIKWHYSCDPGLTVMGLPHNTVVGLILPRDEHPCWALTENGKSIPGYQWNEKSKTGLYSRGSSCSENAKLLDLSAERMDKYPLVCVAPTDGELWVMTNDADAFRFDNAGEFFMKLVHRSLASKEASVVEPADPLPPYCRPLDNDQMSW